MKKRIAVIPARGGSKRIINKNTRDFCGRPMISYVLETARNSGLFDVIHVSTESSNIKSTVEDLGFEVDFLRPADLADDHTPIMPVLKYVSEKYASLGQNFDEIWLLMACSPLLTTNDLAGAVTLFDSADSKKCVVAVTEYPAPIEWALTRDDSGEMIPVQPGKFAVRSQDFEKKYFDAGVFIIFPAADVNNAVGAGTDMGKLGYVYDKERSIDIDEEADWIKAEALYRIFNHSANT